ncbi:hypothetical protein C9439_06225 [archaeon SCG-AAA382B04]|nr:hypothetical protein C9439_06225 [archaeon SCG-AAA382B04]
MISLNLTNNQEGVSKVLGYILIFAIVITSVGIVVTFGFPMLNTARDSVDFQKNKNKLKILQNDLSELSMGPIRGGGLSINRLFNIETGSLELNSTKANLKVYKNESLIYENSIGEIKYLFNNKIISIQNNGLFSKSKGTTSSTYLMMPPFFGEMMNSSSAYINFHIINFSGESTTFSGTREIYFKNKDFNIVTEAGNVSETSNLTINLETNYVGGWEKAFRNQLEDTNMNYSITRTADNITLRITNTSDKNDILLNVYESKINFRLQ